MKNCKTCIFNIDGICTKHSSFSSHSENNINSKIDYFSGECFEVEDDFGCTQHKNMVKDEEPVEKNNLISIGCIGLKKCYLNISKEEAIERYCKSEGITTKYLLEEDDYRAIEEIEFTDEFEAYAIF